MSRRCAHRRAVRAIWTLLVSLLTLLSARPGASLTLSPGDLIGLVTDTSTGAAGVARIDRTTGDRTFISSASGNGITVGSDGAIYLSQSWTISRVDPMTGAQSELIVPNSLGYITDVDFGQDGRLVAVSSQFREWQPGSWVESIRVWDIDPVSGQADMIAMNEPDYGQYRVLAAPGGNAYYTYEDASLRFADASTGIASTVDITIDGDRLSGGNWNGLSLHPDGSISVAVKADMLPSDPPGYGYGIFNFDPATGEGALLNADLPWDNLAVDLGGDLIATALSLSSQNLFTIDLETGAAQAIPGDYYAYDIAIVPIPEPSTGVLVGLGLLAMSARRRGSP